MILTDEILDKIVSAIEADRTKPVVLPPHAYGKQGEVVIRVDLIPIDLHRHLHNLLIRPLERAERMHDSSGVKGNVNPYLFTVVDGMQSPDTHCRKGHPYAGNEMPPNSRRYRCRICYLATLPPSVGVKNADKTTCPAGHEYTKENTYIDGAKRRRCLTCKRTRDAEYRRRIRNASRKDAQ